MMILTHHHSWLLYFTALIPVNAQQNYQVRSISFLGAVNSVTTNGDNIFAGGASPAVKHWKISDSSFFTNNNTNNNVNAVLVLINQTDLFAGRENYGIRRLKTDIPSFVVNYHAWGSVVSCLSSAGDFLFSGHPDGGNPKNTPCQYIANHQLD